MSRVDEAMRKASGVEELPRPEERTFPVEIEPPAAPPPPSPSPDAEADRRPLLDRIDPRLAQKVVVSKRVLPVSREQYRRMAASLHHAQAASGIKTIMITSALPGEGKTLTASNLALTFSESYQRSVLLVDGDLRKPGLHAVFGLDNSFGLAEALVAPVERRVPVQQVSERLAVLAAGRPTADPMAALTSDRMRRIFAEGRETFDWVIIDTPPVALLSDANLLGRMVDAAVLVVAAGTTQYELVQRAVEAIGRDRTFGAVLNRADSQHHATGYGHYSHYYSYYPSTS